MMKLTKREHEAMRSRLFFGADLRASLEAKGLVTLTQSGCGGIKVDLTEAGYSYLAARGLRVRKIEGDA